MTRWVALLGEDEEAVGMSGSMCRVRTPKRYDATHSRQSLGPSPLSLLYTNTLHTAVTIQCEARMAHFFAQTRSLYTSESPG